jgi:hypothetical protein
MTRGLSPRPHDRTDSSYCVDGNEIGYWTVTVTVEVVCPNAFVAYRVYVVVAVGVTETLDPRTAPICGETIT